MNASLRLIAGLALVLAVIGSACSQSSDTKFAAEAAKEKAAMAYVAAKTEPADAEQKELAKALADQTTTGGYRLMGTEDLKKAVDAKSPMLLIDTMPADNFAKEHIQGAVNFVFPVADMPEWNAKETGGKTAEDYAKLLGPDKDRPIVVYCGFVKCTRSHNAAVWALKLGYTDVTRVPGGLFAWKGHGYPLVGSK